MLDFGRPFFAFITTVCIAYMPLVIKKILSLYRLTMGQARQEELLDYIYTEITDEQERADLKKCLLI